MSTATRLLMLTLVAMMVLTVFTATQAKAQDDDDEDGVPRGDQVPEDPQVQMSGDDDDEPDNLPEEEEAEEEEAEEGITGLTAKTIFLNSNGEAFPAGEWVDALLAFDNADDSNSYIVRFVASHINQVQDINAYVQNFTGNTYERTIEPKSSGSFKYRFKPHESLDPRDYNLVVRIFFSTSNNETLALAAFNSSITITEPLGTDPELIMTFVTIAGLIGGVVYYFKNIKAGSAPARSAPATSSSPSRVEGGTEKGSYDKNYISDDHLRFQAALDKAKTKSASPKRSASKK